MQRVGLGKVGVDVDALAIEGKEPSHEAEEERGEKRKKKGEPDGIEMVPSFCTSSDLRNDISKPGWPFALRIVFSPSSFSFPLLSLHLGC